MKGRLGQSRVMSCPYCGKDVLLVNSEVVYGPGHDYGNMWVCSSYPDCDSYVGCHKGTQNPLGGIG